MNDNGISNQKPNPSQWTLKFIGQTLLDKKLNNWLGYTLIFFVAVVMAVLISRNMLLGLGVFGGVVGLGVAIFFLVNTEGGFYTNIAYCFVAYYVSRLFFNDSLPVGVITDVFIVLT